VIDNALIHRNIALREAIEAAYYYIKYLLLYSLDLNLIKLFFLTLKA